MLSEAEELLHKLGYKGSLFAGGAAPEAAGQGADPTAAADE